MEHNILREDLVIYYNYYNNANIIEHYTEKQINDFLKHYDVNNIKEQKINNNDLLRNIGNNQTIHNNNIMLQFMNGNNIVKTY